MTENEPVVWIPYGNGAALLNEEYRVLETVEFPPQPPEGEEPLPSPVAGIPQLTGQVADHVNVGETVTFGETDFTGFLDRLYQGFMKDSDLKWEEVLEVQLLARYNVKVLYHRSITIDFGTLDRADTKVKLAAYLLKDNGLTQAAVVDVTNPDRVYYRPKK